jgi:hypothetical protein
METGVVDVEDMWGRGGAENSDEGRRRWRADDVDELERHPVSSLESTEPDDVSAMGKDTGKKRDVSDVDGIVCGGRRASEETGACLLAA